MLLRPFRWLGRNLSTLLIAFFLAAIVWISAVLAADPNQTCEAPESIQVEILGENDAYFRTDNIPNQVSIEFFAPQSVCLELQKKANSLRAIVDLTNLEAGDNQTVPVTLDILDDPTLSPHRIVRYDPETVQVSLVQIVQVAFQIDLEVSGEPALGFQAEDVIISPPEVTLSGPETLVAQVDRVQGAIDISGVRQSIQTSLVVQALNEEGSLVSGVTISPSRTSVRVPVRQLGGYRDVAVQVKTDGQWATGYRLTSISVSPPTVTVFSENPQQVNNLPGFIETIPIDLTSARDDIVRSVELNLPTGITLVGIETVLVQVNIAAIESNLTINLPIELIGSTPAYGVELSPETVDVILFGPLPVLDELTPLDVRVVVDLTGLGEGTYQLKPLVDFLPEPLQEQGINPSTVEVTLILLPTPTPTPTPTATPTGSP